MAKLVLSVAEVALALGVSRRTICRLLERGLLPVVRVGARRLIPVYALEAFVRGGGSELVRLRHRDGAERAPRNIRERRDDTAD